MEELIEKVKNNLLTTKVYGHGLVSYKDRSNMIISEFLKGTGNYYASDEMWRFEKTSNNKLISDMEKDSIKYKINKDAVEDIYFKTYNEKVYEPAMTEAMCSYFIKNSKNSLLFPVTDEEDWNGKIDIKAYSKEFQEIVFFQVKVYPPRISDEKFLNRLMKQYDSCVKYFGCGFDLLLVKFNEDDKQRSVTRFCIKNRKLEEKSTVYFLNHGKDYLTIDRFEKYILSAATKDKFKEKTKNIKELVF